jgi:hypothetical protein
MWDRARTRSVAWTSISGLFLRTCGATPGKPRAAPDRNTKVCKPSWIAICCVCMSTQAEGLPSPASGPFDITLVQVNDTSRCRRTLLASCDFPGLFWVRFDEDTAMLMDRERRLPALRSNMMTRRLLTDAMPSGDGTRTMAIGEH